jgi:hypothetical protein
VLKFSDYQPTIDEGGVRSLLSAMKSTITRTFSRAMKGLKKLKSGQALNIRLSLPKMMDEAKDKQTGKKGGELAEVALLKDLHRQLSVINVDVKYGEEDPPRPISVAAFNQIYAKNLKEYRAQEAGNKQKREKDWIAHGKAGANHIMTYLHGIPGEWDMYEVLLVHLGEELTGKSKGDINIQIRVKDSDKILKDIGHMSIKTTLDGTPFETPNNGLQTSWNSYVFQVLTGKTSRQLKYVSELSVERDIARASKKIASANAKLEKALTRQTAARTDKQAASAAEAVERYNVDLRIAEQMLKDAKEAYKGTLEYNLDELGKKLGYKTSMAKYMEEITDSFTRYYKSPGRSNAADPSQRKSADITADNKKATFEYTEIVRRAVEATLKDKKKKQEMIKGIMALGGIESGLDYLALGVDERSDEYKKMSAAVSTLGSSDYKKLKNQLTGTLDAKVIRDGNASLKFTVLKNRKEILSFALYKEINNSRIALPSFESPDGKSLSIMKRFAKQYEDS